MATTTKAAGTKTRGLTVLNDKLNGAILVDARIGDEVTAYYIAPVAAQRGAGFTVEKCGSGNEVYRLTIEEDGATCSCPAFRYRPTGRGCKHIDAVIALRNRGYLLAE